MTIIDFQQKKEAIINRGAQYRAGEISEAVFRASLMAMGLRRDDISTMVADNSPETRRNQEQERYEASIQWLREYLNEHKGRGH